MKDRRPARKPRLGYHAPAPKGRRSDNSNNVAERLLEIYTTHRDKLGNYPTEWEYLRWSDLVVNIVTVAFGADPGIARTGTDALTALELLTPTALADKRQRGLSERILEQAGLSRNDSVKAVNLLSDVSSTVTQRWGHLQVFLRDSGTKMVDELAEVLQAGGIERTRAQRTSAVWLQRAVNLPVLHPDEPHIREFCKAEDIGLEILLEAADSIGLDLVVLDDLLPVHHAHGGSIKEPSSNRRKT